MKNTKYIALILALVSCASCGKNNKKASEEGDTRPKYNLQFLSKYNGAQVSIEDERLTTYLDSDDENVQADILYNNKPAGKAAFKLDNNFYSAWMGGEAPYTVEISSDNQYQNDVYNKVTSAHNIEMLGSRFMPATSYFIRITDSKGASITDSFVTNDCPIIPDLNGVLNVRDLGGWKVNGGESRINFGKIYRGANIDYITEKGKDIFLNDLKIKTDLDLRGATEAEKPIIDEMTASPSGCEKFVNIRTNVYDDITKYPIIQSPLYKQIFEYLAEPTNYPIYFHCTHGADRTGTLAFLLEGLLGVSFEDMIKDYELTSFYYTSVRWRNDIVVDKTNPNNVVYSFKEGSYISSDSRILDLAKGLYNTYADKIDDDTLSMNEKYSRTMNQAIERYVMNELNITQEQVDSIRNLLIK